MLFNNFSYYAYKIATYNSKGFIESESSRIILSWQLRPPSPPFELNIIDTHSTGFILKFKEPIYFNGNLEYYLIKIIAFIYYFMIITFILYKILLIISYIFIF